MAEEGPAIPLSAWVVCIACSLVGWLAMAASLGVRKCLRRRRATSAAGPASTAVMVNPHGGDSGSSSAPPRRASSNRIAYFDFWRVLCCLCVVVNHSNERYSEYNVIAVQNWVLPFFTIIAGHLFGMTKSSLLDYCSRLLLIFSVGTMLNWATAAAMHITDNLKPGGRVWYESPADVCLFQLAYVLLLVGGAIAASPLKYQLDQLGNGASADTGGTGAASPPKGLSSLLGMLAYIALVAIPSVATVLDAGFRGGLVKCGVTLALSFIGVLTVPKDFEGLLGWCILGWIYGNRVIIREPRPGSEFHLADLYVWALLVQRLPLLGREAVGRVFVHWWPYWMVMCGIVLTPGLHIRADQHPAVEMEGRLRHYAVEVCAVLAFHSVPTAGPDLTNPVPQSFRTHMAWLNQWSLFAFIVHKAVYNLVGGWPWGISIMMVSGLPFLALFLHRPRASSSARASPQVECTRTAPPDAELG